MGRKGGEGKKGRKGEKRKKGTHQQNLKIKITASFATLFKNRNNKPDLPPTFLLRKLNTTSNDSKLELDYI